MMQPQHHHTSPVQPSLLRRVGGWSLIALGIAGIVLPALPGVIFVVLGIVVLGPRTPLLRRTAFMIRQVLRRWSRMRNQRFARLGWWVRLRHRTMRLAVREHVGRAHRGEYRRRHYLTWMALMMLSMIAYAGVVFAVRLSMHHLG